MANEVHGKNGRVYSSPLLIDNTSAGWTAESVNDALSYVSGPTGGGTTVPQALRNTCTTIGAATLLATNVVSPGTLAAYSALMYYARTNIVAGTASGDLQILLDDTAHCASPIELLNVPALTQNVWQLCLNRLATPASDTAIISLGIKQVANLQTHIFDLSNVYALKDLSGAKNWSLKFNQTAAEVTNFNDAGVKRFIAGEYGWSGSFTQVKTGIPLSIGDTVYLALGESLVAGQQWAGEAIITDVSAKVDIKSVVEYSYSFTGSGFLQIAVA